MLLGDLNNRLYVDRVHLTNGNPVLVFALMAGFSFAALHGETLGIMQALTRTFAVDKLTVSPL